MLHHPRRSQPSTASLQTPWDKEEHFVILPDNLDELSGLDTSSLLRNQFHKSLEYAERAGKVLYPSSTFYVAKIVLVATAVTNPTHAITRIKEA